MGQIFFSSITEDRGIITADELTLSEVERYSDVKTGDQIIWVYDNTANRLTFVVDLGDTSTTKASEVLYDDTASWLKTVWQDIIDDQKPEEKDKINVNVDLGANKKATVYQDGNVVTVLGGGAAGATLPFELSIPKSTRNFFFQIEMAPDGTKLAAIVMSGGTWEIGATDYDAATNTYTFFIRPPQTASVAKSGGAIGTIYTVTAVAELIAEAKLPIADSAVVGESISAETAKKDAETLAAISAAGLIGTDETQDVTEAGVTEAIVEATTNVVIDEIEKKTGEELTEEQKTAVETIVAEADKPATELPDADAKGVITLVKDVELAEAKKFVDEDALTLDLNGHDLTVKLAGKTDDKSGGAAGIAVEGDTQLTITGTGTIEVTGKHNHGIVIRNSESAENTPLKIESGVTVKVDEGGFANGADYFSNCVMIDNTAKGTVDVEIDGTLVGCCGFYVNGSLTTGGDKRTANINGVIDASYIGMYLAGSAVTAVNGAEITGGFTGIEISNGTLYVNSGTITGEATPFGQYPAFAGASGQVTKGAGIAVSPYNNGAIRVEVRGGTIRGYYDLAFAQGPGVVNPSVTVVYDENCLSMAPFFAGDCAKFYTVSEADAYGDVTITGMVTPAN